MRRDKNLVDMSILQSGGYSSSKVLVKKEEERHEKLLEFLSNKEESKIINGKISDLIPNDVMINYGFFCDFLPNESFFLLKIYDLGNSIWALNFECNLSSLNSDSFLFNLFTKTCSTLLIKADNISDRIIWETISTLSKENTEFWRELIVSGTYIFDFLYKIAKQVNFSKECYLNYNSPFIIYNTFLGNIKGNLFEKKNVEYFDNDGGLCALMVLGNYDPSNVVVLTSDSQTMFATPALIEDWIQKNCGFDLDSMDIVELCGKYNLASKLLELVRPVDESLKLQEKNFTKMRIM